MENRYRVEFYETEEGRIPVQEFILDCEPKMRSKIFQIIDLLGRNGPSLRMPYSKYLSDGIFEIRIKQGSDHSRILYFFIKDRRIVLTNSFVKKSKRTPSREIEKAENYRADYRRRYLK